MKNKLFNNVAKDILVCGIVVAFVACLVVIWNDHNTITETDLGEKDVEFEEVNDFSEEAEPEEVTVVEEVVEEPDVEEIVETIYYEPVQEYVPQSYSGGSSGRGADFMSSGVIYDNGTRYSWYSQNALPGGGLDELNANGRHVDDEGIIRDADGYVAVASCDHEKGTIVDTPFGEGKVYDYCGIPGTIDIYTNF